MTETWCALLNVLILSLVSGMNAVLIHRTNQMRSQLSDAESERRR